jgi:hypothetical protein
MSVDQPTRMRLEELFHPFFRVGAETHIELRADEPPEDVFNNLVVQAFRETQNNQIVFSLEVTL